MFIYLFIFFIIVLVLFLFQNKIKIKWKTFLKKGFKPDRGVFGIYVYCGKQGSGKTYSVVEYLHNNKDKIIYSNIHSITGIDYIKINTFDDLLSLRSEHDCIIVWDEIFTQLSKQTKINTDVLDFLCQMRKRRIIFLTTSQEWAEIPLTFRRFCRYQINCRLIRVPIFNGILIKNIMDAENMHWSNDDNDFVAPLVENTISHTVKKIANSYDTFEQIGHYSSASASESKDAEEEEIDLSNIDNEFYEDDFSEEDFINEQDEKDNISKLLDFFSK